MLTIGEPDIDKRLTNIGVPSDHARLFAKRRMHSEGKMQELRRRLSGQQDITSYPNLTIFAAGSYARGEASEHSDVDLFFIIDDREGDIVDHPRLREVKVMSAIIKETEIGMHLPPPSNDGEFLRILSLKDIINRLGGPYDDVTNNFTSRMLMLLESLPLHNAEMHSTCIDAILDSYLRDYENHQENFHPTFIVNDILRFWKTLCLNYENKRNQKDDANKVKQKIRNFKLGYSRLLTCFATISVLSSYNSINKSELASLFKIPPIDRLLLLSNRKPDINHRLLNALAEYNWFIRRTASTTIELEEYFNSKNNRVEAFSHARKFGDEMYEIVRSVAQESGTLRYLVI